MLVLGQEIFLQKVLVDMRGDTCVFISVSNGTYKKGE